MSKPIRPIQYLLVVERPKSVSGNTAKKPFQEVDVMAEGTIKKKTDKGFGFIDIGGGEDIFFHSSNCDVSYDDLQEGQRVSYTEGSGPKGPRAENVKPV
jgi:CspA family cold shock protein